MGCGTSTRNERNGGDSSSRLRNSAFNLRLVSDDNMKNYLTLISNGIVYIDFNDLNKNPNLKDLEAITVNGSSITPRRINDKESISKFLSSTDRILKVRDELKMAFKNSELGIFYNPEADLLVLFLIISNNPGEYEEDLCQILSNNKLSFSNKFEIQEKCSLGFLLKILNSMKNNQTVKSINLSLIIDDFILNTTLNNLIVNTNLEKIKCSKLGLTDENLGMFNEFFTYNQKVSKLKIDGNKIGTLETVKNSIVLNPNLYLSYLNLTGNKMSKFNFLNEILSTPKDQKMLHKLKLQKCNIKDTADFNSLFPLEQLKVFSNLIVLDLSFNFVSLNFLVSLLNSTKTLRKLTLQKIKYDASEKTTMVDLGEAYVNSVVENFSINFDSNDAQVFKDFFTGFSKCSKSQNNKKIFKIFKSNIDKDSCDLLFKGVVKTDTFAELDLSFCSFSDFEPMKENLTNSKVKSLTTLNLTNCNLKQEDFVQLSNLISLNSSITNLQLEKNSFANLNMESFCASLSKNTIITKLNLNYCFTQATNKSFKEFCDLLTMKNLSELWMENCEFPNDSFGTDFSKFLNNNNNIKILKLGSKDEIYKPNVNCHVLAALSTNVKLEEFTFSNIKVTKESLNEFLEKVANQIKKLALINISVNSAFIEYLPKLKKLESLHISLFNLTSEEGADTLKTLIASNSKLSSLILDIPNITSRQIETVVEGLKTNRTLKNFEIFPKREELPSAYNTAVEKYYKNAKECTTLTKLETVVPRPTVKDQESEQIVNVNQETGKKIFESLFI